MNLSSVVASATLSTLLLSASLHAAGPVGPAPSFDPDDQPQAGAGLDSVSPYNGQLALTVPIGPAYEVGPGLSFQLRLFYSSHVWGPGLWALWPGNVEEPYVLLQGDPTVGLGWRLCLGQIVEVEGSTGVPAAYVGPDGSAHALYDRQFSTSSGVDPNGFYYSRDGSYLRVKYSSGSGYKLYTPDGNITTLGKQVTGQDDATSLYTHDFKKGLNGWYVTAITNPYNDAITVTYQTSAPWIPLNITIPSLVHSSGSGAGATYTTTNRTIAVSLTTNGTDGRPHLSSINVPSWGSSATATYTFTGSVHASTLARPIAHPNASASPYYLDSIDLPLAGYGYDFAYFDGQLPNPASSYARGAIRSQTIPTGATISYEYGTWTFYHANPLNRPGNGICQGPNFTTRGILRTGSSIEPNLPAVGDCNAPDRTAGVVKRSINLHDGEPAAEILYYHYDFPRGEGDNDLSGKTQSETLVVSPADKQSNRHSTSYLFAGANTSGNSDPMTAALLRVAVFHGDASGGLSGYASGTSPGAVCTNALFCANNARRIEVLAYDVDDSTVTTGFGNRRVRQKDTHFLPQTSTQATSPQYHTVVYGWDQAAGRYKLETHSGTIGNDAREIASTWQPKISPTQWKLDVLAMAELRPAAGGTAFSRVTNTYDSYGFVTAVETKDVSSSATMTTSTPRDGHGFPYSESFSKSGDATTYTRTLTHAAGALKSSEWSTVGWKSADFTIDANTGLISTGYDPNDPGHNLTNLETTFTYDVLGRPLVTTPPKPSGGISVPTTVTYDSATQSTVTVASSSPSLEYAWSRKFTDALGRVVKLQKHIPNPTGSSTPLTVRKTFDYDDQGHTIFESEWVKDSDSGNPPGTTFLDFDDFGRPGTITKADGKKTTIAYGDTILSKTYPDSVWKKTVTIKDVNAAGTDAVTTYTSDAFGDLVSVVEPIDSNTTTYIYNVAGKLTGVTQGSAVRTFTYDALGFLKSATTPEAGTVSYTYDALGNVATSQDASGVTITRTYDTAGRLTAIKNGSSSYLMNCYDGASCNGSPSNAGSYTDGKLTRRIGFNLSATVTEEFTYAEGTGRLSSKTSSISLASGIGTTTERWYYDPSGAVIAYQHPHSTDTPALFVERTTYDHGLPVAITANGLPVVSGVTYHPSGTLAGYATGLGTGTDLVTTIAEDATSQMARPSRITASIGGSTPFDTDTYTYDGAGNITKIGTDSSTYDKESRLLSASIDGTSESYTYDRNGNMLTRTSSGTTTTYTIQASSNRISQVAKPGTTSVTPQYDTRGNITTLDTESFGYDNLNRQTTFAISGATYTHVYDGSSEKVVKLPPSGTGYFYTLRDPARRVVTEYVGKTLARDNVYLGRLLVASYSTAGVGNNPAAETWQFHASDHLGTPRVAANQNGSWVTRNYLPFGTEIAGGTTGQRTRFAGMELDLEELPSPERYSAHAREHDLTLARFMSPDLVPGGPANPQSWNRYSYALNNPLRFVDPTGLDPEESGNPDDGSGGPSLYICQEGETLESLSDGRVHASVEVEADSSLAGDVADDLLLQSLTPFLSFVTGSNNSWSQMGTDLAMIGVAGGLQAVPSVVLAELGAVSAGAVAPETQSLFRAVGPNELADIQATGAFRASPGGLEGKYFATTAEGASRYARMAVRAFGDEPYTLVETSMPVGTAPLAPYLDGGIPTIVVPNQQLPLLGPLRIWPFMPRP